MGQDTRRGRLTSAGAHQHFDCRLTLRAIKPIKVRAGDADCGPQHPREQGAIEVLQKLAPPPALQISLRAAAQHKPAPPIRTRLRMGLAGLPLKTTIKRQQSNLLRS